MGPPSADRNTVMHDGDSLRQLAAQKEQEWKQLQELRIHSLEATVADKEKQLSEEKNKFLKLKDDFKYNLRLLQDRDGELERYDAVFIKLKAAINAKDGEVSDLKIRLDELKTAVERESRGKEEMQIHYQQRLRQKQADIDAYRNEKDAEVNKERENLEAFKRKLERQLKETEEELDIQKQELNAGFDEAMKRREHEFRLQADEMSTQVLAHEMKVKLLSKELELLKAANERCAKENEEVDGNNKDLEKQLRDKAWQIQDITVMKDARISELESKLEQTELSMKKMQEDFQRKHAEMNRYAREKETALTKVKEAHHERERSLTDVIRDLQSQTENSQVESRRLEWNLQDVMKEKDICISNLKEEISELKEKWDKQMSEVSRSAVARDLEMEQLRADDQKLKAELVQKKEAIERYKRELNAAVEREAVLERSKAQLELDWQRRYEDVERVQYERSEDLIKSLTQARNEARAAVKEKSKELSQRDDLIKVLSSDREQALATLQQHGLTIDRNIKVAQHKESSSPAASEQIQVLQQQNESLKNVIKDMRQEMEQLGDQLPKKNNQSQKVSVTNEYVQSLEEEIRELKNKNRMLEIAEKNSGKSAELEEEQIRKEVSGDALVRAHIESLNNTIACLRSEKVELSAQVRKQQVRLQHLESMADQLSKQPREKQVEVEQLQYELNAQSRRHKAEVSSLQQRLADTELQLQEVRREADEYYKGNLQGNMENMALGNELSALKVDMAKKNPAVNFGAQELLIQQLQDEIQRLRQLHKGDDQQLDPYNQFTFSGQESKGGPLNEQLQKKLRTAAKHIKQLAVEKQQLIEMGNRLRAELLKNGIQPPSATKVPVVSQMPVGLQHAGDMLQPNAAANVMSQKVQSKLQQLQQLQYQLTKQELAKKSVSVLPPDVTVKSSSESNGDHAYVPQSILKPSSHYNSVPREPVDWPVSAPYPSTSNGFPDPASHDMNFTGQSGDSQRMSSPSHLREQPLQFSLSSVGGESLQEIWRMLDDGAHSPLLITPRPVFTPKSLGINESENLVVAEQKSEIIPKWQPEGSTNQSKRAGKVTTPKTTKHKGKIRNYNVRDDAGR